MAEKVTKYFIQRIDEWMKTEMERELKVRNLKQVCEFINAEY